jgi:hypothetical protein
VAAAILIAASSNNVVKGIYAYAMSDRRTGISGLLSNIFNLLVRCAEVLPQANGV